MNTNKLLSKTFEVITSNKGIVSFIFMLTLIILTILLSSRYYLFQNIIDNGISTKDIIATKTIKVVDVERTQKRKQDIAQKVEPILRPVHDDYIKGNLSKNIATIKKIRKSNQSIDKKKKDLINSLDVSENTSNIDDVISYLLNSSTDISKIIISSNQVLDEILEDGVTEFDLSEKLDNKIASKIERGFSRIQVKSIIFLTRNVIAPNMVIDELATDIARKNAINSVKPITKTFEKGEKIVASQEVVTRVQKAALQKIGYNIAEFNRTGIMGIFCIVAICLLTLIYYLVNYDSKYILPSYMSLISLLSISVVIAAVFLPSSIPVYILPFAAMAILMTIFTNPRIALLTSILLIVMIGTALQYKVDAISVFVIAVMVAIFTASKINFSQRIDLIRAGINISLANVLVILSMYLLQSSFIEVNLPSMGFDVLLGFISGIISGVIALGTLPLIESTFKIITPFGLAELASHNQPLLKRLQFEAPGTYHHSLLVSNLAEAAAESVGANPILCKVGAFYHDIGKLKRPLFFIENQSYFGIENPHEKLNPRLSKMVVTAHPKDGVEIAKEYNLPTVIHQFITQHHGDSIASYFYNQALKEEGVENVLEDQFRYTGAKPNTKETAILMLADAVESAVRSLKTPTQEEIELMIDKIIKGRLHDGQLSNCPLTLKDLKTIAATFNRILRGMQHHRIKYHENVLEELENKTRAKRMKQETKNNEE